MRLLAVAAFTTVLVACARDSQSTGDAQRTFVNPTDSKAVIPPIASQFTARPYPPGRWRLTSPQTLYPVLIRLAHILIRHEGVQEGIVSFQLADWTPSPAPPARTLDQA